MIRPAAGVMSAFDSHGCAVVDTRTNRWLYFTGDEAWVWQSTELLGSSDHLDAADLAYLHFFVDTGLMVMEDETSVPFSYLEPEVFEYEKAAPLDSVVLGRPRSTLIRRAWRKSAHPHGKSLTRTVQKTQKLHRQPLPYIDLVSLRRLHIHVINSVPWWVVRSGRYDRRSVALAVCIAAHLAGARVDLSFGVRHDEPHGAAWWCSVPEGSVGRFDDVLLVGTV